MTHPDVLSSSTSAATDAPVRQNQPILEFGEKHRRMIAQALIARRPMPLIIDELRRGGCPNTTYASLMKFFDEYGEGIAGFCKNFDISGRDAEAIGEYYRATAPAKIPGAPMTTARAQPKALSSSQTTDAYVSVDSVIVEGLKRHLTLQEIANSVVKQKSIPFTENNLRAKIRTFGGLVNFLRKTCSKAEALECAKHYEGFLA